MISRGNRRIPETIFLRYHLLLPSLNPTLFVEKTAASDRLNYCKSNRRTVEWQDLQTNSSKLSELTYGNAQEIIRIYNLPGTYSIS
jgi:hypothetical protein